MTLTRTFTQTHRHYVDGANAISVGIARRSGYPLIAECGEVWIPGYPNEIAGLPMCPRCDRTEQRQEGLANSQRRAGLTHYVYRLFDADGVLLYVGMTYDPPSRRLAHKKKPWWPDVASFRLTIYPDKDTAARVESQAIWDEHPLHNKRGRRPTTNVIDLHAAEHARGSAS